MVNNFLATTRSGATYQVTDGHISIIGSSLPDTYFTVYKMYSNANPTGFPWTGDTTWTEVDTPVVGERLAIVGRDEWRISSAIQTLT